MNIDNTITNAYQQNLSTRGTGSNMGASDTTEVFSIFAQQSTSSSELSRALYKFPVGSTIATDRTNKTIPASGSVSFYLKLYNARHSQTLPKDFYLTVAAITRSWGEGTGLDMEGYTDKTYDEGGSNWIRATGSTSWASDGGDIYTDASSSYEVYFDDGTEDLELDVTTLVEQWLDSAGNVLGSKTNNGKYINPLFEFKILLNIGIPIFFEALR